MTKSYTVIFFLMLVFLSLYSQQLSLNLISSTGGRVALPNLNIEWSLGETAVESGFSGSNLFTQGFHQPHIKREVNNSKTAMAVIKDVISAYPNPATNLVHLNCDNWNNDELKITLINTLNQSISKVYLFKNVIKNIDVNIFGISSGAYLLNIQNVTTQSVTSIKILKTN